jgi:RF-1 domain
MSDEQHPAALNEKDLLAQCTVRRQRRSGPGGQHRNKVETAIVLVHNATQIRGEASERRSQAENREQAIQRLRVKLAIHVRSELISLEQVQVSSLWMSRLTGTQIRVSCEHADFPTLLAEVCDILSLTHYEIPQAATLLHCTNSQLLKFLKLQSEAWQHVNTERQARGLHPLQ